jgi:hypothetical protein
MSGRFRAIVSNIHAALRQAMNLGAGRHRTHGGRGILACTILLACTLGLLPAAVPTAEGITNTVTVTDKSGSAQANYPLQFARPFLQGEIRHYPQILVNGTPLTTQADVKQRWPDGSVKHAILSVLLPSLTANGSVTLTFQDQATGNNTPLAQGDMLGANYDFDAAIQIAAGGQTRTASARTMLTDGSFTYWTRGPVATTILLADHGATRAYDIGFDALNSIRPIFEATFWPGINKVRVRFIGENSNSEALEDVGYDLALTTGAGSPQTVYSKAGYIHKAATRWTKVFWLGGAPESRINVDSNLAYLVQTCFVPMYDTSLVIPESVISGAYTSWLATPKDIQDGGWWCRYMPTTGGRDDIGHLPKWSTQWLYTGDYRSKEIAFGNADLAPNWQMQVREGDVSKLYDRAQTIPAIGKPVSICARPPLWIFDGRGGTDPSYWIPIQGTNIPAPGGDWTNDNAHQPDPFSVQYMLTGDHWYLEQLQMWAAFDALSVWPAVRGPAGYAGIVDQVRGDAWAFRTRVNAAFLSPDGTAEKDYLTMLVNDAIAHWDGWHGVTGAFMQSTLWKWAKDQAGVYGLTPVSPLHCIDHGNTTGPWQEHFVMTELGIAREKGFSVDSFARWESQYLIRQFSDAGYYPYRVGSYYLPVVRADGTLVATWGEVQALQVQSESDAQALASFNSTARDTTHGYAVIASAAGALIAGFPGGDVAWSFLKANVRDANPALFAADPKWAINPRSTIRTVGTGKTYATVQAAVDAAADWDTIQIFPGTYAQEAGWANITKSNLTFIGMGSPRPVLDAAGSCLGGKGIFAITGQGTIIQNLEFKNARNTTGKNAAGIYLQGTNTAISECYFHDNDNGVLASDMAGSAVSIESSEFNHNGAGDGASHNVSVGVVDSFSLKYCWVHTASAGCEVKTGAKANTILYSRIGNEGGNGTYEIQAARGGTTWIIGNQIEQSATGGNAVIIDYGSEGAGPDMHLYVVNNTIVNNQAGGTFVNNPGTTGALVQNNIFQGAGTVLAGPGAQTTNWATSNADLRDVPHYDFHLTSSSAGAINTGTIPGTAGGLSLVPSYQYVHPCSQQDRVASNSIDIGAYTSTPPVVVNAGANQSVFRPAAASLSGSATGGSGAPLTYTWSMVSGPGTVTLADPSAAVTTATFDASGIYVLQLAVTDGLVTGTSTVTINVDPPGAVTDLSAGSPTPSSLVLTWTAPGDAGATGTAASYEIRYSTSAITDANFASATKLASPPAPAAAGTSQGVTISGLTAATVYSFALKTTNHAGTVSAISNVASGQTAPVHMDVVAIKRNPGLTDGRGVAPVFANALAAGTITVYTGQGMIADAGSLHTDQGWAQGDIYLNYGGSPQADAWLPLLVKFGLNALPSFAGSTINKAELRFYTSGGNQGMYNTGYVTTSDWIEGSQAGGFPGPAGGVSGAHPMGFNTGTFQAADGTAVNVGYPPNMSIAPFSWAGGQPFAPAKDGVSVVRGVAHNPWGINPAKGDSQYVTIDITPIVQAWARGTTNYGLFVDSTGNYAPYLSENATTPDWQPVLFVEYYQAVSEAASPAAPQLGQVTGATVQILNLGTENNATTEYLVQESTTGQYVGPNGRLQAAPFWQARQVWTGTLVWGLNGTTAYQFRSKARNSLGAESSYGPAVGATTMVLGDINGDGHVNVVDILYLADAWGSASGDTAYDVRSDLNGDGRVDLLDLVILAGTFGM